MAETKKLGELLKEAGLIDDYQLQSALAHQRNWGGKLGSVVVEMGFLREPDVAQVLAEKFGMPYVDLFEPEIPQSTIRLIKPEVAKKYNVIPVKKESTGLVVGMADPLDIDVVDAIRFATGLKIKPALALESEIKDAISKYYDGKAISRKPSVPVLQMAQNALLEQEPLDGMEPSQAGTAETKARASAGEKASEPAAQDYKIQVDALVSLLIEKGLIKREELMARISGKFGQ